MRSVIPRSAAAAFLLAGVLFSQTAQQPSTKPSDSKPRRKQPSAEPLWQKLLRVSGVSATPSSQRGPEDELKDGQVWVANLDPFSVRAVTSEEGFRWPVFAPDSNAIFCLEGNKLVRFALDTGRKEDLFALDGIYKLVGFNRDNARQLLVMLRDNGDRFSLAYVSIDSGQLSAIPFDRNSSENQATLNFLKASERVYGSKRLYAATATKEDVGGTLEWIDAYLRDADAPAVDVSRCDGVNCGQPSLSANARLVVFIKAER